MTIFSSDPKIYLKVKGKKIPIDGHLTFGKIKEVTKGVGVHHFTCRIGTWQLKRDDFPIPVDDYEDLIVEIEEVEMED